MAGYHPMTLAELAMPTTSSSGGPRSNGDLRVTLRSLRVERDRGEHEAVAGLVAGRGPGGRLARFGLVDGQYGDLPFEPPLTSPGGQGLDGVPQVVSAQRGVPADRAVACDGLEPGLEAGNAVARTADLAAC